ncbi:hypothetical protein NDU88_002562 [Pleurodeles waltl]|uniref:Uncharacterized protein n=1 Tax=Pleurodeles waltl TaxID=8319 RepID=A0AAV7SCB7_PLEWA|nr:hypothetical protein NDU88_002562 [Pleurodeles waltl]
MQGISDHSPVVISLKGRKRDYATIPRIDPWYLRDQVIGEQLWEGTVLFKENVGLVSSRCILGEAFKVVLRGQAQALIGGKKKEKTLLIEALEREVGALEAQLPGDRSEELRRRFTATQTGLHELAENEARKYAQVTQRRLYDTGDQTSKLLAWLVCRDQKQRGVSEIMDESGGSKRSSPEIAEVFACYYEKLYSTKTPTTGDDCADLLKDMALLSLTEVGRESLKGELTTKEIGKAIGALQVGTAVGQNGLPVELYKALKSRVAPHLT